MSIEQFYKFYFNSDFSTNMDANIVTVQAPNGTLIFQSDYNRSTTHPEYLPFSAYAPAGVVTTVRDLKYLNN